MGFEYQKAPHENRGRWTYTDEKIDSIYKQKASLKIDTETELGELKKLQDELQKQYEKLSKKLKELDNFFDENDTEYNNVADEQWETYLKLSAIEDWIDNLEELNEIL